MRIIGAHVSIAGGIEQAPKRAAAIGCNALQLFSGSPRTWSKIELDEHHVDKLFSEQEKYGIKSIITHAIYLTNLASDKDSLVQKSINTLTYDMKFDALVKGWGVVVHLGSHQGRGWAASRDQVVSAIKTIIEHSPDEATFLIENSAGQNGKLCSDLEHVRWLLDEVNSQQLGWCFDTCHGFAAGYDLGAELTHQEVAKARNQRQETVSEAISRLDLWEPLQCVHVNDSKGAFGSGIDKHQNLGEGEIPWADFEYFLNLNQLADVPLILEVPGFAGEGPDEKNVRLIRELVGE